MTANVSSPIAGFFQSLNIPGEESIPFELPPALCATGPAPTSNASTIVVEAEACITLHGEGRHVAVIVSADMFVVFPERELGTDYIIASYPPREEFDYSEFTITSPNQDTDVTIRLTAPVTIDGTSYDSGSSVTIVLTQYESMQLQSSSDLTGTRIFSTKPIAVVSGNACNIIVEGGNHDYFAEQLPSVDKWGSEFTIAPFSSQSFGYTFRVIAAYDDTSVMINGVATILQESQVLDRNITTSEIVRVVSSHHVLVVQFMRSYVADIVVDETGPSMILINANNQYSSGTMVFSVSNYDRLFASVVVLSGQLESFTLDGASFPNHWNATIALDATLIQGQFFDTNGRHVIQSNDFNARFAVYIYSTGISISNAYSAAFNFGCSISGEFFVYRTRGWYNTPT